MPDSIIPSGAWNCHVHCFNPERHPFKPTRAYTPFPAPLNSLLQNSYTDNIVVVQATIDNGPLNLLESLDAGRKLTTKDLRGTVLADPDHHRPLQSRNQLEFYSFHEAGIRSIRIHGSYGGAGDDLKWVQDQFLQVARLGGVITFNWSVSAQLPLRTWARLADTILNHPELRGVNVVADHNGSAIPADLNGPDLRRFIDLLTSGHFFVKIGALHRRSPADITLMKPIIRAFLDAAPGAVVWGSDWPHIDARQKGLDPSPPLQGVDTVHELRTLRSWMSDEEWVNVLVHTPERLYRR